MSTSSRAAPGRRDAPPAQPFPYRDARAGAGAEGPEGLGGEAGADRQPGEICDREQAARALGRKEGKQEAQAALQAEFARIPAALAETLTAFAREREAFYQKVEGEVVGLALSIARKVLHREAQVDPLLLAGMVRVALEGMESRTRVTVRLNPRLLESWREYFRARMDPGDLPELVEDPTLEEQRCVLETHLGKAELGWEVQLKEIEQGLLDLLAQRPRAAL
jgi:flagellar assembly protein FliH